MAGVPKKLSPARRHDRRRGDQQPAQESSLASVVSPGHRRLTAATAVTSGRGGAVVPIDNDVYDRMGGSWWDETNPLNAKARTRL